MTNSPRAARLTRLRASNPEDRDRFRALTRRAIGADAEVETRAQAIVSDVKRRGDVAVREHTESIEGRSPGPHGYEIVPDERARRAAAVDPEVRAALERAGARIRAFHEAQTENGYSAHGGAARLRVVPHRRVGLYAPGGTARYPSSVLMTAIPAEVAGVDEIVLVTPDASPEALAAADIAGVSRVFELGGAQAIAALAFGTEAVPRVDKIAGPGNAWVTAAKRAVYGEVDIDALAGPSEVLIIADESAEPRYVAADLLAQAEHDTDARPLLFTTSEPIIDAVEAEIERQLGGLSRREVAAEAIARHGIGLVTGSANEALALAEEYAPEHLELAVKDASRLAETVRAAGAVFVGHHTPEAAGDYIAGPNHVLPTGGAARFSSPLGAYDFRKRISILELDRDGLAELRRDIGHLARVEGLDAHARSVEARFEPAGDSAADEGDGTAPEAEPGRAE